MAFPPYALWWRRLLLIVVAVATVLLILFGQLPWSGRWVTVLSDSAHGPASALIAACIFGWRRNSTLTNNRSLPRDWVVSLMLTVALGALIELVQYFIGRDAEASDVMTDVLGAVAGTSASVFSVAHRDPRHGVAWIPSIALSSACLATIAMSLPALIMMKAYLDRDARFPLLMDADALTGTYFFTPFWIDGRRAPLPGGFHHGQISRNGYRVRLASDSDWGLGILELTPDWSRFNTLTIDIVNPVASRLSLGIRVFSHPHGLVGRPGFIAHYSTSEAGPSQWRIPLKTMQEAKGKQHVDLTQLRGLVIFQTAENRAREFYVVSLRVE